MSFAGDFAPALFYSVTGTTAYLQSKKHAPREMLLTYGAFFFLGFSYNGIIHPNVYAPIQFDIAQIIALASLLIYGVARYTKASTSTYVMLAVVSYVLKDVFSYLLLDSSWKEIFSGTLLPPGVFPLIAWIFLFFLGVAVHQASQAQLRTWLLVGVSALGGLYLVPFGIDFFDKWVCRGAISRFLAAECLPPFSSLGNFRKSRTYSQCWILWGKTRSSFYTCTMQPFTFLKSLASIKNPYLFWFSTFLLSLLVRRMLMPLPKLSSLASAFAYKRVWVGLLLVVLGAPVFLNNQGTIYGVELVAGILLSLYTPALTALTKSKASREDQHRDESGTTPQPQMPKVVKQAA